MFERVALRLAIGSAMMVGAVSVLAVLTLYGAYDGNRSVLPGPTVLVLQGWPLGSELVAAIGVARLVRRSRPRRLVLATLSGCCVVVAGASVFAVLMPFFMVAGAIR